MLQPPEIQVNVDDLPIFRSQFRSQLKFQAGQWPRKMSMPGGALGGEALEPMDARARRLPPKVMIHGAA